METYNGHVRTPTDAIILFEACRLGILPRVQRRLSEKERQSIRSGSVFVWDEREAGMRRWTDGKSWSASRVSGSFLTYREMEGKRGSNSFVTPANKGTKTPDSNPDDLQNGDAEEGPDGYRYKPDGLMKQSFSITTSQGQHLHLISYYSRSHPTAQGLRQPSTDPNLAHVQPAKGLYPESTINDQSSVPAVTRSPMVGVPSYVPYGLPHTLPPGLPPPLPYPPPGAGGYSPHAFHMSHPPPSVYDQRPLRTSESAPPPVTTTASTTAAPAPPISYSTSQSLPPPTAPLPSPGLPPPSPREESDKPQIDPRLTAAAEAAESQHNGSASKPEEPAASTGASQAPTIHALVHNVSTLPPPPPPVDNSQNEAEVDRQGSTSPGGTKNGAPPQDIPSEKLGFREDKRALSKLDRVFARV
ncbi:Gluconate transport-inducing protein [Exophiala oligosperma]